MVPRGEHIQLTDMW